jgi:hypothetical protein
MSLNRCEQRLFDYVERHPEERHYWTAKVQSVYRRAGDHTAATLELEQLLWAYYEERSAVAVPFKEAVRTEGLRRTSMKNLAELLLRLWTEPKPRRAPPAAAVPEPE